MNKKKLLYFLLSLVVAFCMWTYVITLVSPESEETFHDVPVKWSNEESLTAQELMLVMEETPTVNLTLTGNRSDLAKLNSSNLSVTVELSRIYEAGEYELTYTFSNPTEGAIGVQSKKPSTVKVTVERRIENKAVGVTVNQTGTVAADCIVQEQTLSADQVLISGPKSVVDQIAMARIDVDMEGKDKTFGQSYTLTLCNEAGEPVDAKWVETNIGSVELTAVIKKVREVKLEVTVVDGGGATEATSNITISPKTIKVSGNEEDLEGLDTLNLGTINLADFDKDSTKEFAIKLPSGVKDLSNNETASVKVEFPELGISELTVTNFEMVNVPEGMEAEILAQALTVRVRGSKTQMSLISAEHVKIVVDFANCKAGTFNANAQVVITSSAFASAGALGTYSVTASLTEAGE